MSPEEHAYINVLVSSLQSKKNVLEALLQKTQEQEKVLTSETKDLDEFELIMQEKDVLIQRLLELEDGFDSFYKKIEDILISRKEEFKEWILKMQKLIPEITELSVKLRSLELQNNERFKIFLSLEKNKIKEFKVSNKTATSYYKNMTNTHQSEQTYFFDKKK